VTIDALILSLLLAIHGHHPSGALRATKFVPDEFVSRREKGILGGHYFGTVLAAPVFDNVLVSLLAAS